MRISDWSSDVCSSDLYDRALDRLAATAEIVELDITPLLEAARLLYGGPWVAERTAAIAGLLARDPEAIDASVRAIVEPANALSAVEPGNGHIRPAALQRRDRTDERQERERVGR